MSRLAALAIAGTLAAGAGVGAYGVATAAAPSPSPSPTASAQAPAKDKKAGRQHRPLLQRAAHAEGTVRAKGGWRTFALQRGTITAVSATSITFRSEDGFQATYVVTADTGVRARGKTEKVADLKTGERAMVIAVKDGSRLVAQRIRCVRTPAAAGATPSTSS